MTVWDVDDSICNDIDDVRNVNDGMDINDIMGYW